MMPTTSPSPNALRVSGLSHKSPTGFDLRPDSAKTEDIARELDLLDLRKLRFAGDIIASGDADWLLRADIGATVVQPCTVTLEPVTTRVDTKIERLFVKEPEQFGDDDDEIEMPEDERAEPLGQWIDLDAVMIEALSLALPEYPRKDDATLGEAIYSEDGVAPMTDEAARPFAGLAALKDQLAPKE